MRISTSTEGTEWVWAERCSTEAREVSGAPGL